MAATVCIVGLPGSGKTTVARLLAARLDITWADSDALLATRLGRPVDEAFLELGEQEFRAREHEVISQALSEPIGVLAVGSGAVLDPEIRAEVAEHTVVWLLASPATAISRSGLAGPRPVLLGNVRGMFTDLARAREPLYAQVADITVDTDGLLPNAAAIAAAEAIASRQKESTT